jgi:HK97 family phage prohead protease
MPKNERREYRSMPVMAVQRAEGEEAPSYKVRGYASTFEEPYVLFEDWDGDPFYEIIDAHAFDEADMDDVIMQYDHMGMLFARTRNNSLSISIDDHGLLVEADLSLTQDSRRMWEAIDTGLVDRMSFCFVIAEDGEDYDKSTKTSRITKITKVYDVSAVSIPANPGTEISAARKRFLDGVIQEERTERSAAEAKAKRIRILRMKARIAQGG